MPESASQLVKLDAIRAAAARIAPIAMKTPLVRAAFPGVSGYGTGREIWLKAESLQPIGAFKIRGAANKILQLTAERNRARRHYLFERQPCAGRGLCGARSGREGGDRHAVECAGHQARGDAGAGRGNCRRGRGLERAPCRGRGTGAKTRLRRDSAVRRRADHRRAGNLRTGNCRRAARMWTWWSRRSPAAACSAEWPRR